MSVGAVNKTTGDRIPTAGMPAIDDALDLTSVNPVQNAIITAALANKQDKTDNNLETTAKTIVGAINEHEGDISSLRSGFTNLDNEVNGDAVAYPYADVITIPDAVPANVADCSVKIEPVQDLHGYDKPWVGGAGDNKLDVSGVSAFPVDADGYVSDATPTKDNRGWGYSEAQYKLSLPAGSYKAVVIVKENTSDNASGFRIMTTPYSELVNNWDTFKTTGTKVYNFTLSDTTDIGIEAKMLSAVARFMILPQSVTSNDWQPYTNICPITGHTEASVQRDGVNQFDEVMQLGDISGATGEEQSSTVYLRSNYLFVNPLNTYYLRTPTTIRKWVYCYDKDKQYLGLSAYIDGDTNTTFTLPQNAYYIRFLVNVSAYGSSTYQNDICLNASDESFNGQYEPFKGKTYTIALGDTIYGGTVDFDSGVMTVDRKIAALSSMDFAYNSNNKLFYSTNGTGIPDAKSYSGYANAICSSYFENNVQGSLMVNGGFKVQDGAVYVKDLAYDDTSAFETAVANETICYELATPTTIQLTPQQIQLLKGTNTLTASTGQISVTVNGVSGAIGAVQEQVNELVDRAIHSKEVSLDGVELNIHVGDVWYQKVTVTLPTGACIIGVSYGTQFEPDVIPYVQSTNAVILTCTSTKTISNKVMTVYYANIA